MRKVFFVLATLLSTLVLTASEPYFCIGTGTKLHYERHKVSSGKLTQTTLFEIMSLGSSSRGREVRYAVTMKKASGKDLFGGRTLLTAYLSPAGDVSLDFGATVKGFVQNMFPGGKVSVTESLTSLPVDMKPGDNLPDTHCTVRVMGISSHFHITRRTVDRLQSITTPAGTFDCIVVRSHKEEDAPFHHPENWVEDYYVPGLGYVRHDIFDNNMRLQESECLVQIEQR